MKTIFIACGVCGQQSACAHVTGRGGDVVAPFRYAGAAEAITVTNYMYHALINGLLTLLVFDIVIELVLFSKICFRFFTVIACYE